MNSNVLIREMLQQHIETTHRRSKIYKCESCVFECTDKTDIQLHIKTEHAGEFECDECSFKCVKFNKCQFEASSSDLLKNTI